MSRDDMNFRAITYSLGTGPFPDTPWRSYDYSYYRGELLQDTLKNSPLQAGSLSLYSRKCPLWLLPRASVGPWGIKGFSLVALLVLVTGTALGYQLVNSTTDTWPKHCTPGPRSALLYPKVYFVYALWDFGLQDVGNNYAITLEH